MVSAITNIGDSFNTLQFSATLALENTHKKLIKVDGFVGL
jgi:hypothetical protein